MVVEGLITVDRLQAHAQQLFLGVQAATGVIAAIESDSSIWLHHSLAEFLLAQDKTKCKFKPWSDADLVIKFAQTFIHEHEFAKLRGQLQSALIASSRTGAVIDFTLVDPFNGRDSGNRFLKELQKSHRGFLIYENGRTSFPW